ncbi:hypothetical protein N9B94_01680 [Verrucomicrobia bacterium]|nr:hypothetical protein [Verrucomicrobiota bacterium]
MKQLKQFLSLMLYQARMFGWGLWLPLVSGPLVSLYFFNATVGRTIGIHQISIFDPLEAICIPLYCAYGALITFTVLLPSDAFKAKASGSIFFAFPMTRAFDKTNYYRAGITLVAIPMLLTCSFFLLDGLSKPDISLTSVLRIKQSNPALQKMVERRATPEAIERQKSYLDKLPGISLSTGEELSRIANKILPEKNYDFDQTPDWIWIKNGRLHRSMFYISVILGSVSIIVLLMMYCSVRWPGTPLSGLIGFAIILPYLFGTGAMHLSGGDNIFSAIEFSLLEFMCSPWHWSAIAALVSFGSLRLAEHYWNQKEDL